MIKSIIIEDEPLAASRLSGLLSKNFPELEVVNQIDSVKESIDYLESGEKPDLIFLDIELADGQSFLLFDYIKVDIPIIFTTAYDQFSLQAFEHLSVDYLLKPVKQKDLSRAIDKFKSLTATPNWSQLDTTFANTKAYKERFLGRIGNKMHYKRAKDISLFYSEDKITYMIGKDQKRFIVDYPLDKLERELLDPYSFYRISRKHIINADAVSIIKTYINQRLSLELNVAYDQPVIVSRERVNDFKSWLNR
ncbi:MAG: LytTR family DNA-binding domain-containing protein [Bacteroidota bacterium]